jgi:hypothetical protein
MLSLGVRAAVALRCPHGVHNWTVVEQDMVG